LQSRATTSGALVSARSGEDAESETPLLWRTSQPRSERNSTVICVGARQLICVRTARMQEFLSKEFIEMGKLDTGHPSEPPASNMSLIFK
jgi:hypothetical protein